MVCPVRHLLVRGAGCVTPAIHRLTDELLAAIAQQRALHDDATVIPFGRCRARKKVFDLADALVAERAKPMTEVIAPWSYWNRSGK